MIALGGNVPSTLGAPENTLRAALSALADSPLKVEKCSRFYATPCFPKGAGPDYVNAAAVLSTDLDAFGALKVLHEIEAEFGRQRDRRWGQRTLDLDLIAVGEIVLPDAETFMTWRHLPLEAQMTTAPDRLILPHPRLQERAFVLIPLCEVAPDWVHPILQRSVRQMTDDLPQADKSSVTLL